MLSSLNHIASLHIAHRTSKIYISICLVVKRMFLQLRNGFYLSKTAFFACFDFCVCVCVWTYMQGDGENVCVHASIEFHLFSPPVISKNTKQFNFLIYIIRFWTNMKCVYRNVIIIIIIGRTSSQTHKKLAFFKVYMNFPISLHTTTHRHRLLLKISFCGKILI